MVADERQHLLQSVGSSSLDDQKIFYEAVHDANPAPDDQSNDTLTDDEASDGPLLAAAADQPPMLTIWHIICVLSTAYAYGCILTTLFMITLPVECERIEAQHHGSIPKSVALGAFVSIAGLTQLISPLIGRLSDTFEPPDGYLDSIGQRMPYLILGSVLTVVGLFGQMLASYRSFWLRYSLAFFLHMIGLNIMYAMMLAIIPDQVARAQTGVANGTLALLLVMGSISGFGLYHGFLRQHIQSMYALYVATVICASILTGLYGHDRDVEVAMHRIRQFSKRRESHEHQKSDRNNDREIPRTPSFLLLSPTDPSRRKTRKQRLVRKLKKATQKVVVDPTNLVRSMIVDPLKNLDGQTLYNSYTIDMDKHRDFFWVTVSRLCYYCGMSVQTFFMYFLKDIVHLDRDPESAVASLAMIGQLSGALTCYPVGVISDRLMGGRRKPFVYLACAVLASATFAVIFVRSLHYMVIVMLTLGAANGVYLTMDTSLAVDTLPKEFDGDSGSAQLLGIWGVAAFLGSALGPMIGGPLLYYVGSPASNSTASSLGLDPSDEVGDLSAGYSLAGYAVVLSMSSFYFAMSSVTLRFVQH